MIIKNVSCHVKNEILQFCKKTFDWGDYIDKVWNSWLDEGNFFCIYDKNIPAGICHVFVSTQSRQIWIEGIRINPKFKRRNFATQLILKSESVGLQNSCNISHMLIENTNTASLDMAKKLNYTKHQTWNFFYVDNIKNIQSNTVDFATSINQLSDVMLEQVQFVKSWRWFPLCVFADKLISQNLN